MYTSLLLLAPFAPLTYAFSIPPLSPFVSASHAQTQQKPLQETLDAWIQREEHIALAGVLANIAPGGRNVVNNGVAPGTVIASPSHGEDGVDYWYQWVRDAAITMDTLVDVYEDDPSSEQAASLVEILEAYAALQSDLQRTSNPSGVFDDLSSLGEPKFHVDGSPFTGSWGRPQRDGPALRALTLMHYLRVYNASHPSLWSSDNAEDFFNTFYAAEMPPRSVIKADLEYVSHYWNESSFDLWEEVEGLHFFNMMVSARALREGSDIARTFGDPGAAQWYAEQAGYVEALLPKFWNAQKGHLVETLWSKRSGLDCGILLGSLHALPSTASAHEPLYPPWSDEILTTLLALTRDQYGRFPINSQDDSLTASPPSTTTLHEEQAFKGTGLGRYPEDIYTGYATAPHGGNPWFLCTSSAASILYASAAHFSTANISITISPVNLPFFTALLFRSPLTPHIGSLPPEDPLFEEIVQAFVMVGDEFLQSVRTHVDGQGSMSEQFDGETGFLRGARDLTWSYGAFLGAGRRRGMVTGDKEHGIL